jgi:hypothetical protein
VTLENLFEPSLLLKCSGELNLLKVKKEKNTEVNLKKIEKKKKEKQSNSPKKK